MNKKRILLVDDEAGAARLLKANLDQTARYEGGRIGGLPFLAKPADLPEVIACLEHHLGTPTRAK